MKSKLSKSKKINLGYFKNVFFCVEDFITYESLIKGDYDELLNIHFNTNWTDLSKDLTVEDITYIKKVIDWMNETRKEIYDDFDLSF